VVVIVAVSDFVAMIVAQVVSVVEMAVVVILVQVIVDGVNMTMNAIVAIVQMELVIYLTVNVAWKLVAPVIVAM